MSGGPMTVQDKDDPWGMDPAERWVVVWAATSASTLWHLDGSAGTTDALPSIPRALAARIEALADRYNRLDALNTGFPEPSYWEQPADMPVAAFNAEGRAIAHALKAALPPDWTVVYEDVDAWLPSEGAPLATHQLILSADPDPNRPPDGGAASNSSHHAFPPSRDQ